jgi:CRP-like cAMP-binding protein
MYLRAHPIFSTLDDRELAFFSRIVGEREVPAGTTLFSEGSESTAFFLIHQGVVGVAGSAVPGAGARLREGEVMGLWSLLAPTHSSAVTARALEPSGLLVVEKADFLRFIAQEPIAGVKLLMSMMGAAWEDLDWMRARIASPP